MLWSECSLYWYTLCMFNIKFRFLVFNFYVMFKLLINLHLILNLDWLSFKYILPGSISFFSLKAILISFQDKYLTFSTFFSTCLLNILCYINLLRLLFAIASRVTKRKSRISFQMKNTVLIRINIFNNFPSEKIKSKLEAW